MTLQTTPNSEERSSLIKSDATYLRKAVFAAAFLVLSLAMLTSCLSNERPAVEEGIEDMESTGSSSMVILSGKGTVVNIDRENMQATILMDSTGIHENQEVLFDFTKHTKSQPVELDLCNQGDQVIVTYFNTQISSGGLAGESLVLVNAS